VAPDGRSAQSSRLGRAISRPTNPPRLVGRDSELEVLTRALDRAARSGAKVVLIEAGPGLGKSRILREVMLCAAERRFAVLHGQCDAEAAGLPFAVLAAALGAYGTSGDATRRRLAADLAGRGSSEPEHRYRAADAAVAFLEELTRRSPALLVLDDFQALRQLVTGVGEITRRVTPLYLAARAAADGDPDTAQVMAFHERGRADGYRGMARSCPARHRLVRVQPSDALRGHDRRRCSPAATASRPSRPRRRRDSPGALE
jgi:hypothetical protein